MNSYARPTTTAQIRFHNLALATCWAALAYFRIAGIDLHIQTAGPAFAPRPAVRSVVQRHSLMG